MEQTTPTGAKTVVVNDNDGSQHISYPDGTKVDLGREPDPQWGFSAPMVTSYKVTTPDGKVDESTMTRSVTLANNDDPLSVTAMTETVKSRHQDDQDRLRRRGAHAHQHEPEGAREHDHAR